MDYKRIYDRTVRMRNEGSWANREYYNDVLETLEMLRDANTQLVEENEEYRVKTQQFDELERRYKELVNTFKSGPKDD